MNIPDVNIKDFDYNLPDEKIAKYPVEQRDLSKLLVFNKGEISELPFFRLPSVVPSGSALIFNNSRVLSARLIFAKDTGAQIEIFCLEPIEPAEYQQNLQNNKTVVWKCFVGNKKRWKQGFLSAPFIINGLETILTVELVKSETEHSVIRFNWDNNKVSFGEILDCAGIVPIPPYLQRGSEDIDKTRYQTIYSNVKGSVAAPTAGLHFTPRIFEELETNGNVNRHLTLHVGAGTFKPVQSGHIAGHIMHRETFSFTKLDIEFFLNNIDNIIAVGTTTARMLESIYWLGVKTTGQSKAEYKVDQWDGFNWPQNIPVKESLNALLELTKGDNLSEIIAHTSIMIIPGYKFRMIKGLVTNFHQPRSSLLLLIAAFAGPGWKNIYRYALDNDFRFLSYGDGSILLP